VCDDVNDAGRIALHWNVHNRMKSTRAANLSIRTQANRPGAIRRNCFAIAAELKRSASPPFCEFRVSRHSTPDVVGGRSGCGSIAVE
jgi:hypothetical protein